MSLFLKRSTQLILDDGTSTFVVPLLSDVSSTITFSTMERETKSITNPLLSNNVKSTSVNDGTLEFKYYVSENNTPLIGRILSLLVGGSLAGDTVKGAQQVLTLEATGKSTVFSTVDPRLFTAYLVNPSGIKKLQNVSLNEVSISLSKGEALQFACTCSFTQESISSMPTITESFQTSNKAYVPVPIKAFIGGTELGNSCGGLVEAKISFRKEITYLDQQPVATGLNNDMYYKSRAIVQSFKVTGSVTNYKTDLLPSKYNTSLEIQSFGGRTNFPEFKLVIPTAFISARDDDAGSVYTRTYDYRLETTNTFEPVRVYYKYY